MRATRFLTLFSLVIAMSFGVRLAEIVTGVPAMISFADAKDEKPAIKKEDVSKEGGGLDDTDVMQGDAPVPEIDPPLWLDAGDARMQNSALQMEMIEELAEKRKFLDSREAELATREAIMQASEKEIKRKYEELKNLKNEIEILLGQQSDAEKARIASLVKVYEGMKAKDAARIFDTLDIDVLVSVMSQMSERRLSPILASMNPERARTVTIILAEQKKLPELPQN